MGFDIVDAPGVLAARFTHPHETLSWAIVRPGFAQTRAVVWIGVRDADLADGRDPARFAAGRAREAGFEDAVTMLTARDVARRHVAEARAGAISCAALATVGLSNAMRIGADHTKPVYRVGTVNLLARVSAPLTEAGFIEAMSIAAEARTAAIMELGLKRDGAAVTGTGTDCIVIAAPPGEAREAYAGMHTAIGETVGRAVHEVVAEGCRVWLAEQAPETLEKLGLSV